LVSKVKLQKVFKQVEWKTIFFFFGLFVMVGGIEKVGILDIIARYTVSITDGNMTLTGLLILWVSALASAFVDNIPFVATMIPLIKSIGVISSINTIPLFWALSLGACLGGNGTLVGASANVIAVGLLEEKGEHVSFGQYFKTAFPLMIVSIIISTIYLLIFEL
jgi:Na+/H+ antiporter NhaD/arsenite permease-like protein